MKKTEFPVFPHISFTLAVSSLVGIVLLLIDAVINYIQMPEWSSGIDYLGFLGYALFAMPLVFIGAVCACFCGIKATITWVKVVSFIMFAIFMTPILMALIWIIRVKLYF